MADFRRHLSLRPRIQYPSAPVYVPMTVRTSLPESITKQNTFNSSYYTRVLQLRLDEFEKHILSTAGRACRVRRWLAMSLENESQAFFLECFSLGTTIRVHSVEAPGQARTIHRLEVHTNIHRRR